MTELPFEMPEVPATARFLNLCSETERKLLMRELPQLGEFQDTFAGQGLALAVDDRIRPSMILFLDHEHRICGSINLAPQSWASQKAEPKPKRPALVYRVRGHPSSTRCRYCRKLIHWAKTPSGATMPLSWNTREAWIDNGLQIGFVFQPHFGDCPTWPGRTKKAQP